MIVARTLLETSHLIVESGVRALEAFQAGEDNLSRDIATATSRAQAEAFGLDWDEIHELAMSFVNEIWEMAAESEALGVPLPMAVRTAQYSALVGAVMATGCAISGVDPSEEAEPYTQHPEIEAGGWICGHGIMVTVLGIDAGGGVAYQVDGELARHDRRPTPDEFLDHYTRIDDVPVLGGGEA